MGESFLWFFGVVVLLGEFFLDGILSFMCIRFCLFVFVVLLKCVKLVCMEELDDLFVICDFFE